ncbi:radical SAM protein, partial [Candidatus Saccharibacteria bacterium]|nr:radical SAM protein [Candidatus Saccharibacteria bacterium]
REIQTSIDGDQIFGKEYSADEVFEIIKKDKTYYKNGGGVTFSGGEPIWWIDELIPLFEKIHKIGATIAVETTGSVPRPFYEKALPYIDYYLVDLKILVSKDAEKIRLDPNVYQKNIKWLLSKKCKLNFRTPLVPGFTFTKENIKLIKKFLSENNITELEVFETHEFGKQKYELLGRKMQHFSNLTKEDYNFLEKTLSPIKVKYLKW